MVVLDLICLSVFTRRFFFPHDTRDDWGARQQIMRPFSTYTQV